MIASKSRDAKAKGGNVQQQMTGDFSLVDNRKADKTGKQETKRAQTQISKMKE